MSHVCRRTRGVFVLNAAPSYRRRRIACTLRTNSLWLCWTIVTVAVLSLTVLPRGGFPQQQDAPQQDQPEQDQTQTLPQKVIVLANGRVITGDIEDRPGGYLVETTVGKMVIPYTQIRLTAVDLPDAYRKLKESIKEPTAGAHIALGQWCFENRLYNSARQQVKAALLLEPERKEARQLLKEIERMTLGDAVLATLPSPKPRLRDGFDRSPAVSLKGLSNSVTQDYVRKVQPLLMNKCGNARCHGAAGTSDFRLLPVRLGMSGFRTMTDQNLTAALQYVDRDNPQASPLLVIPQGSHGGKGPIWTGPRADEQRAELRAWVTRAVLSQTATPTASGDQPAATDAAGSEPIRDPLLEQVLAEERPDPFDPALFNRQMHGRD